jgi:hypothetical protein
VHRKSGESEQNCATNRTALLFVSITLLSKAADGELAHVGAVDTWDSVIPGGEKVLGATGLERWYWNLVTLETMRRAARRAGR